ncbi:Protein of unknown function [Oryzisolibacter propanilivorax]|uniref:YetF C-terminal domain-containing protein n=1 Tax=Oryzisolibacter propanilivorax TaxID=1527607 RepID=A0A1G9VI13_9BURK|nr:YetF domain-containing protein [Oryzisolibacter propanilivorax]SDM71824.1 Protein of unknown function [Oryzisolibacter propanilivorax]
MFDMSVPWWEFVLRGVVVYVFLLVFLRLTGRRQTGQLAPFDLVLLLVLSNAVQNSMNAGDNSLVGGLISAATLLLCHVLLAHLTYRCKWLERLVDGSPQVLVRNGQVDERLLRRQLLTREDLMAALRAGGCLHLHEVERATIEANGDITVVLRARSSDR